MRAQRDGLEASKESASGRESGTSLPKTDFDNVAPEGPSQRNVMSYFAGRTRRYKKLWSSGIGEVNHGGILLGRGDASSSARTADCETM